MIFYVFLMMLSCGKVESKVETAPSNRKEDMTSQQQENDSTNIADGSALNQRTDDSTDSSDKNPKIKVSVPQADIYLIKQEDLEALFPDVVSRITLYGAQIIEPNLQRVYDYFRFKESEFSDGINKNNGDQFLAFIRKTIESFKIEDRVRVATWLLFNITNTVHFIITRTDNNFEIIEKYIDLLINDYGAQVNVVKEYNDSYSGKKINTSILLGLMNISIGQEENDLITALLEKLLKTKLKVRKFDIISICNKGIFSRDIDVKILKYALDNQKNEFKDDLPEFISNLIYRFPSEEAFKLLFDAMLELNTDLDEIKFEFSYNRELKDSSLFFRLLYGYMELIHSNDLELELKKLERFLEYVLSKYNWNMFIYDSEDKTSYHSVLVEIGDLLSTLISNDNEEGLNKINKLFDIILSSDINKKALNNWQLQEKSRIVFDSFKAYIDDMLSSRPTVTPNRVIKLLEGQKYHNGFGTHQKEYLKRLYESYTKLMN